jgi:hypothetical protein
MVEVIKIILAFYLVMDLLIMSQTGLFFPITVHLIKLLLRKLLRRNSCIVGLHDWEYNKKEMRCTGLPHYTHTTILTRVCQGKCNKHQWKCDNRFTDFRDGDPKEPMHFTTL